MGFDPPTILRVEYERTGKKLDIGATKEGTWNLSDGVTILHGSSAAYKLLQYCRLLPGQSFNARNIVKRKTRKRRWAKGKHRSCEDSDDTVFGGGLGGM